MPMAGKKRSDAVTEKYLNYEVGPSSALDVEESALGSHGLIGFSF